MAQTLAGRSSTVRTGGLHVPAASLSLSLSSPLLSSACVIMNLSKNQSNELLYVGFNQVRRSLRLRAHRIALHSTPLRSNPLVHSHSLWCSSTHRPTLCCPTAGVSPPRTTAASHVALTRHTHSTAQHSTAQHGTARQHNHSLLATQLSSHLPPTRLPFSAARPVCV